MSSTPPVWLTTLGCAKNQVARFHREAPESERVLLLDCGEPGRWLPVPVTATCGFDPSAEVLG